jgi:uncharacterized membrane protein YjgN (DUF898 family)
MYKLKTKKPLMLAALAFLIVSGLTAAVMVSTSYRKLAFMFSSGAGDASSTSYSTVGAVNASISGSAESRIYCAGSIHFRRSSGF